MSGDGLMISIGNLRLLKYASVVEVGESVRNTLVIGGDEVKGGLSLGTHGRPSRRPGRKPPSGILLPPPRFNT